MKRMLIVGTMACILGCQKKIVTYNDDYDNGLTPAGAPTITSIVRTADTARQPAAIASADMGEVITIRGTNLSQVRSITFNGLEANPLEWYAVNSYVSVRVPRALLDDSQITNQVVVTTTRGSATANLVVAAPRLVIDGFYNDFAEPGDTVRLLGRNFDLYEFVDGGEIVWEEHDVRLPILEATDEYVVTIIPAEAPTEERSVFSVTSAIYTERGYAPVRVALRDYGLLMQTYADGYWGSTETFLTNGTHRGDPHPFSGLQNFTRIAADYDAYAWEWVLGTGYNKNAADYDMSQPQNYQIKMELNTTGAIPSVVVLYFEGASSGDDKRYKWQPSKVSSFDTNKKWRTITFEAADFVQAGYVFDGTSNFSGFAIAIQPSAAVKVDFSIANTRIVKKIN